MSFEQQQKLRLLRPTHLLRLERGGPQPAGDLVDRHHLHNLGPGNRPGGGEGQRLGAGQDAAHRARQRSLRHRFQVSSF